MYLSSCLVCMILVLWGVATNPTSANNNNEATAYAEDPGFDMALLSSQDRQLFGKFGVPKIVNANYY